MQALLRSTSRKLLSRPMALAVEAGKPRAMSGHGSLAEHEKEMSKWRLITLGAVPLCAALSIYHLTQGGHHHADVPKYPYMRVRHKEFPWGDCALFDRNCEL